MVSDFQIFISEIPSDPPLRNPYRIPQECIADNGYEKLGFLKKFF